MFSSGMQKLILLVLGVLVLLGDEKQSVSLLVATAGILALYIFDWYTGYSRYFVTKKILFAWSAFFVVICISSLGAISMGFAITDCIRYVDGFLLYIYFSNRISGISTSELVRQFYYWTVALILISCFVTNFSLLQNFLPMMNLLYRSYGHSHVVDIILFLLPYGFSTITKEQTIKSVGVFSILLLGILTSFSRGAILLLIFWSLIYLFLYYRIKQTRKILFAAFSIIIIGCLTLSVISVTPTFQTTIVNKIIPKVQKNSLLDSRKGYWIQSVLSIPERPLFGHGPGSFYLVSKKFQQSPNSFSWYAHSFPLQVLVEIGAFGFALLLYVLVLSLKNPFNKTNFKNQLHNSRTQLLLGVFLVLAYSIVEMNLDFTVVWLLFWIFIGVLNNTNVDSYTNKDRSHSRVSIVLLLFILSIYYLSSLLSILFQAYPQKIKLAAVVAPYDAKIVENYLDKASIMRPSSDKWRSYFMAFHENNATLLYKASLLEPDHKIKSRLLRRAILNDPQNRDILEDFITYALKNNRMDDLLFIVRTMVSTISVQKNIDISYIDNRWNQISICFKEDTLIWNDTPYTDTYQAKSLYYASLCLIKTGNISDAKTLMKIAVDSRPSWSTIYIDYASLLRWQGNNPQEANSILEICKKNINAAKHCSEYEQKLPIHSIFDMNAQFLP